MSSNLSKAGTENRLPSLKALTWLLLPWVREQPVHPSTDLFFLVLSATQRAHPQQRMGAETNCVFRNSDYRQRFGNQNWIFQVVTWLYQYQKTINQKTNQWMCNKGSIDNGVKQAGAIAFTSICFYRTELHTHVCVGTCMCGCDTFAYTWIHIHMYIYSLSMPFYPLQRYSF